MDLASIHVCVVFSASESEGKVESPVSIEAQQKEARIELLSWGLDILDGSKCSSRVVRVLLYASIASLSSK